MYLCYYKDSFVSFYYRKLYVFSVDSLICGLVDQIKLDYDLLNGRLTSLKEKFSDLSEQIKRERNEQLKFRELVWKVSIF